MRKIYLAIGALALVGVLAIAGCGGGGSSTSSSGSSSGGEESSSETASSGGRYGGGESESASEGSSAAESEASAEPAAAGGEPSGGGTPMTIEAGSGGDLGKVIVDAEGMTVYDFHKDKGTTSSCYGSCAEVWPPVLTSGAPKASGGAQGSLLGTTKRKDGTVQVTYKGHPLYTYVQDKKTGDVTGNDVSSFGAQWYALEPSGEEPEDS